MSSASYPRGGRRWAENARISRCFWYTEIIAITAGLYNDVAAISVKQWATRSRLAPDPIFWALPDHLLGKTSQVQSIRMASYDFLDSGSRAR
jgi:hypothetical protein